MAWALTGVLTRDTDARAEAGEREPEGQGVLIGRRGDKDCARHQHHRTRDPGRGEAWASPAHDVADDVGVTHEHLVAVLLLLGVRPVDVVPEGGLDPGSVLVILLGAEGRT